MGAFLVIKPTLLVLALCFATSDAHPGCIHDEVSRVTGGVRNTGYTFNRKVPYGDGVNGDGDDANGAATTHGRRAQSSNSGWGNIRVQLEYVSTSELTTTMDDFLRNTLMADAMSWISNALLVQPVAGALKHSRVCELIYNNGDCHTEGALPTCGVAADGSSATMPTSMLDELTSCTTCYSDSSIPCTGCTTSPAGAGASNTDFVLYVSAVSTASCSGGTLAYAATCQRDQNDRPIFGYANFCPASLDTAAAAWLTQRSTAVHEILHALGFSTGSWPLFRDENGVPRTLREADGLPALMPSTLCTDGTYQSGLLNVSSTTLEVGIERGA